MPVSSSQRYLCISLVVFMMIIQGTKNFLLRKGADLLARAIAQHTQKKSQVVLGVSAGDGVVELLELLADYAIDWRMLHLFQLDAGLDSIKDGSSLSVELCRVFGKHLEPEQLHLFPRHLGDPGRGLKSYCHELAGCGGRLDLVLMSCGEHGAIAGLYPNHPFLEKRSGGYEIVEEMPEKPYYRIAAGSELISGAKTGVLLAFGASMITPLQNFFDTYLSEIECPAKLLTRLDHYYLLTDQDVETP